MPGYQCTPITSKKIYDYLLKVGKTKLMDLTKSEIIALIEMIKPRCQNYSNCTHTIVAGNFKDGP